jgi:hypothetical protein
MPDPDPETRSMPSPLQVFEVACLKDRYTTVYVLGTGVDSGCAG